MLRPRSEAGQPLKALILLLLGWLVLRIAGFGDPVAERAVAWLGRSAGPRQGDHRPGPVRSEWRVVAVPPAAAMPRTGASSPNARTGRRQPPDRLPPLEPAPTGPSGGIDPLVIAATDPVEPLTLGRQVRPRRQEQPDRWSGDAWLLWRAAPTGVAGGAFYGASQVGAVIRYRLDPTSRFRPALYLRGAAALAVAPEQDAALGLGLRPFSGVPVAIGAEVRMTRNRFATRARAALVAVTEAPPLPLPLGFLGEVYGQGGWISGPGAELFGDLQLRAERKIGQGGGWQARAGAGLWAAGQRGAARVDFGPTVAASGPLGSAASARLELGWRLRTAGNAAPGSGPALVLASSF